MKKAFNDRGAEFAGLRTGSYAAVMRLMKDRKLRTPKIIANALGLKNSVVNGVIQHKLKSGELEAAQRVYQSTGSVATAYRATDKGVALANHAD